MSANEHFWVGTWGLMSTQECSLHHGMNSWMLLSALELFWLVLSAHGCTKLLLRYPECSSVSFSAEWKCKLLKWPLWSIFVMSPSRYHQIMKKWIFLKSTRKGLLKKISWSLGRRKIQRFETYYTWPKSEFQNLIMRQDLKIEDSDPLGIETGGNIRSAEISQILAIRNWYLKVFWPKRNFAWPWNGELYSLSHTISNFDWFFCFWVVSFRQLLHFYTFPFNCP